MDDKYYETLFILMKNGFYKNDNGTLLYAPNSVHNKDYELLIENQTTYKYPVYGWYYFNSLEAAGIFFNIDITPYQPTP